jgi:thymidylate synthase (FAD)
MIKVSLKDHMSTDLSVVNFATFHVKAPLFVARQLARHKSLHWDEVSWHRVDDWPEFYTPDVWRGRSAEVAVNVVYYDSDDGYNSWPEDVQSIALEAYQKMLELGVAPEQARMVLPQSMMTEWYWSGSLDAFADMCNSVCKPNTELELQMVANEIDKTMADLFSVSWSKLRN